MPYTYVRDKRDQAPPRRPPVRLPGSSSSSASKIPPTLDFPLIVLDSSSQPVDHFATQELYNLNDITGDSDLICMTETYRIAAAKNSC